MHPEIFLSNRFLAAMVAVASVCFVISLAMAGVFGDFLVPDKISWQLLQKIEELFFIGGIMFSIQVGIMLSFRHIAISLTFWLLAHVLVGASVATWLWSSLDTDLLNWWATILKPGVGAGLLLLTYVIRFLNSTIMEFETTKGWL